MQLIYDSATKNNHNITDVVIPVIWFLVCSWTCVSHRRNVWHLHVGIVDFKCNVISYCCHHFIQKISLIKSNLSYSSVQFNGLCDEIHIESYCSWRRQIGAIWPNCWVGQSLDLGDFALLLQIVTKEMEVVKCNFTLLLCDQSCILSAAWFL